MTNIQNFDIIIEYSKEPIMNKVQTKQIKHRAHRILFDVNSPFRRAKTEKLRVAFKRQPKHRSQLWI